MKPTVLVIDDEEAIRESLRMILEHAGYRMVGAGSGAEGLRYAADEAPDIALLDIKMARMDGLEVLGRLRAEHPGIPVLMISGHGTIATAVEAIRAGAFDFMEKPLERDVVLVRVARAIESLRLREEVRDLRLKFEERFRMVGSSPAITAVQEAIARAAPVKAAVLVTGESGSGKELVARAIHKNSPRAAKPFVRVNCAAIPEELIESELFGHEKGSFTGATRDQQGKFVQADTGTIFLDEVGDMSLKTQAKVLRVLQDGEVEPLGAARSFRVDVRVIAATNKDLPAEIAAGRFREDLYWRLAVVPIAVPPLRDRMADIEPLARTFAVDFARENALRAPVLPPATIAALRARRWRGNVRELKNAVERLIIMGGAARGGTIEPGDVAHLLGPEEGFGPAAGSANGAGAPPEAASPAAPAGPGGTPTAPPDDGAASLQQFKDRTERAFLVRRLRENNWNVTATARLIDTPRSNLYKKLEQYAISRERDG